MFKLLFAGLLSRLSAVATPNNVEAALASFNKLVDNLQAIADRNLRNAAEHALAAKESLAAEALAKAEADRAALVAGKVKALTQGA
jgi:hypothetical protein